MMKFSLILLLCIAVLSCQFSNSNQETSEEGIFEKLSKEDFAKTMAETEDKILIDVRTPKEYNNGFIAGALNINFYDKNFDAEISKIDKEKAIFIYCQKGGRSGKALNKMKKLGFKEVYDLIGGYGKWIKSE